LEARVLVPQTSLPKTPASLTHITSQLVTYAYLYFNIDENKVSPKLSTSLKAFWKSSVLVMYHLANYKKGKIAREKSPFIALCNQLVQV